MGNGGERVPEVLIATLGTCPIHDHRLSLYTSTYLPIYTHQRRTSKRARERARLCYIYLTLLLDVARETWYFDILVFEGSISLREYFFIMFAKIAKVDLDGIS